MPHWPMRLKQLIEEAQKAFDKYGDMAVFTDQYQGGYCKGCHQTREITNDGRVRRCFVDERNRPFDFHIEYDDDKYLENKN